jgi:hypothetical protein
VIPFLTGKNSRKRLAAAAFDIAAASRSHFHPNCFFLFSQKMFFQMFGLIIYRYKSVFFTLSRMRFIFLPPQLLQVTLSLDEKNYTGQNCTTIPAIFPTRPSKQCRPNP